ncbi:MAG: 2-amino-4-hydroxy-6-hydroxymethyldihydropteridine diphosphokinase [Betaproteobacteria bacterium]
MKQPEASCYLQQPEASRCLEQSEASRWLQQPEATRYFVGLGANLGDRIETLKTAISLLTPWLVTGSLRQSSFWESEALDGPGPNYINAVIQFDSPLGAIALLDTMQSIESTLGRQRSTVNAPRTLDLDLLLVEDLQIQLERLIIPHPRMHQRAFVLYPLLELDSGLTIPGLGAASKWLGAIGSQACRRWID